MMKNDSSMTSFGRMHTDEMSIDVRSVKSTVAVNENTYQQQMLTDNESLVN